MKKLTQASLKGVSNRALFACKNGRFASNFLLLGVGFLEASKQANSSFKSLAPKPHLNRTGSVFALPYLKRQIFFDTIFRRFSVNGETRFKPCFSNQALFKGYFFPGGGHAIACGYGCGNGGEGSSEGVGGDSAVQPQSMGGGRGGGAEGHTQEHTHTHRNVHANVAPTL